MLNCKINGKKMSDAAAWVVAGIILFFLYLLPIVFTAGTIVLFLWFLFFFVDLVFGTGPIIGGF